MDVEREIGKGRSESAEEKEVGEAGVVVAGKGRCGGCGCGCGG